MSYLPSLPCGSLLDMFKAFPDLAEPLNGFAQALMRGESPFTVGERELIAAYVGALNGCTFCRAAHAGVAERAGVRPEMLEQLLDGPDVAAVDDRLKPVLTYVRKLNDAPAKVTRADAEAVLAAGWDERALIHAALVCGWANLMNRWVNGLGVEADPHAAQMAADMLHRKGYVGLAELAEEPVFPRARASAG